MTVKKVFSLKMPDLALVVMECWLIGGWGKGGVWCDCWGTDVDYDRDGEGCSWWWLEAEEPGVGSTAEQGNATGDWYELLL